MNTMLKKDNTINHGESLIPFFTKSYPKYTNKKYLKNNSLHNHSGIPATDEITSNAIETRNITPPSDLQRVSFEAYLSEARGRQIVYISRDNNFPGHTHRLVELTKYHPNYEHILNYHEGTPI